MQKACKLDDKHEYAKILQENCKNNDIRIQLKGIFLRHLQSLGARMGIAFGLVSLQ